MKHLSVLLLVLIFPFSGICGELETLHRETYGKEPQASKHSRTYEQANPENTGFSEVGLERVPWYNGSAPVYTVIIKPDGSIVYTGIKNVPHLGKYTGQIETDAIAPLFQFLKRSDFMFMDSYYSTNATDQETVYTMASVDGKRKVIRNEGKGGHLDLWILEQLIDGVVAVSTLEKIK